MIGWEMCLRWRRIWCLRPVSGKKFEQGVAAGRVAIDAVRKLGDGQASEPRDSGLRFADGIRSAELVVVVLAGQRMVDDSRLVRMPTNDGEIGFVDLLRLELRAQRTADLALQRKQQYARSAAIQAMHGMDVLADLVAQDLHREARFVAIENRPMHQQSGWLVHGDQVFVAEKNRQFFPHARSFFTGNSPSR